MELFTSDEMPVSFITFSGGEEHVQIEEGYILSPAYELTANLTSSTNVMRLFLFIEALNGLAEEQERIVNLSLSIPYLPYARQDRRCATGQAFSLQVFWNIFSQVIYSAEHLNIVINILDVHSKQSCEETDSRFVNVNYYSMLDIIKEDQTIREHFDKFDFLIAPDKGALNKVLEVAKFLDKPVITFDKERNPVTGWIENVSIGMILEIGEKESILREDEVLEAVKGKSGVVLDDICDGGMTFNLLIPALDTMSNVSLHVTHGIFSKGIDALDERYYLISTVNNMSGEEGRRLLVL